MEERNPLITPDLIRQLEQVEGSYWMCHYHRTQTCPAFSSVIGGGIACAMPEHDILAMNRVIGLGQSSPIQEGALRQVIRFYQLAGSSRFFLQLPPSLLNDRTIKMLREYGFSHHNNWTKLYREVSPIEIKTNPELSIRRIFGNESDNYGQLIFMSFDWEDSRLASWLAGTVGQPGYHHYIVSCEGRDIAAGALYVEGEMASMAFAGTLPSFRGKGAQALLLKTRMWDAIQQRAKYITGETAEHSESKPIQSFLNMRKCGFQTAYQRQNWIYHFDR